MLFKKMQMILLKKKELMKPKIYKIQIKKVYFKKFNN